MSKHITLKLYSLAERMPDLDSDVLVFDSEDPTVQIGAYVGDDDDGPMWVNSHGMPIFNVTDWADLPSRADAQPVAAGSTS
jgi:hypothetical protein